MASTCQRSAPAPAPTRQRFQGAFLLSILQSGASAFSPCSLGRRLMKLQPGLLKESSTPPGPASSLFHQWLSGAATTFAVGSGEEAPRFHEPSTTPSNQPAWPQLIPVAAALIFPPKSASLCTTATQNNTNAPTYSTMM